MVNAKNIPWVVVCSPYFTYFDIGQLILLSILKYTFCVNIQQHFHSKSIVSCIGKYHKLYHETAEKHDLCNQSRRSQSHTPIAESTLKVKTSLETSILLQKLPIVNKKMIRTNSEYIHVYIYIYIYISHIYAECVRYWLWRALAMAQITTIPMDTLLLLPV